ncbi:hypothetical protein K438DRAFT_1759536 [Mycena galopus ATCC 62051]|nr:hypothetical protein K438DRAFT_1759536 [Mycena galopus ATCC 62051]
MFELFEPQSICHAQTTSAQSPETSERHQEAPLELVASYFRPFAVRRSNAFGKNLWSPNLEPEPPFGSVFLQYVQTRHWSTWDHWILADSVATEPIPADSHHANANAELDDEYKANASSGIRASADQLEGLLSDAHADSHLLSPCCPPRKTAGAPRHDAGYNVVLPLVEYPYRNSQLVTMAEYLGVSPYQAIGVVQQQTVLYAAHILFNPFTVLITSWTRDGTPDPGAACGDSIPYQTGVPVFSSTTAPSGPPPRPVPHRCRLRHRGEHDPVEWAFELFEFDGREYDE